MTLPVSRVVRCTLTLALLGAAASRAEDPCLLSLVEARELGGSDVRNAVGENGRCSYRTAEDVTRIRIDLADADSAESRARLAELGDASRFTERRKGKITYWVSSEDELAGWARRGDRLAEVHADGEASVKRRRRLERALQLVGERLR